ncbi:Hpt domain-containing protein [Neosynechococcus sphagnicola]|uniref:Hpt domain-containing protein n=1 Tax=Neosynechococcus sphagnicola TaxID=1501145 RepID=UPI000689516F|nr:Hpt domain-containing protein [Neosynechococcus sphagnicola]
MQPEQQRIVLYFIEEAKEHLDTIEHSLLNLQATIADAEGMNEVFRAAHSIKGGAAMLGLGSIQATAHRLEDSFKILKECPIVSDQHLESLFLRVFDPLRELVEELQGPFGLTDEASQRIMAKVEPVFGELSDHLNALVTQAGGYPVTADEWMIPVPNLAGMVTEPSTAVTEESALLILFQRDIPALLQEMQQVFAQPDQFEGRVQLQEYCRRLIQIGEQFDLSIWCELMEMAQQAIANVAYSLAELAQPICQEIEQARCLVIEGRSAEIMVSPTLQAWVGTVTPISLASLTDATLDDFAALPPTSSW